VFNSNKGGSLKPQNAPVLIGDRSPAIVVARPIETRRKPPCFSTCGQGGFFDGFSHREGSTFIDCFRLSE
jgi:hypothetical protein